MVQYLQLQPESKLPDISALNPFRTVVIAEEPVALDWLYKVSSWLVWSGTLYVMTWGNSCEYWHDSIDFANMEVFNFEQIPEEKFVMTTWHENEPLEEVFWFSKNSAFHPIVEISNTLILHISNRDRSLEFLSMYENS
jgi:hypothetical protein